MVREDVNAGRGWSISLYACAAFRSGSHSAGSGTACDGRLGGRLGRGRGCPAPCAVRLCACIVVGFVARHMSLRELRAARGLAMRRRARGRPAPGRDHQPRIRHGRCGRDGYACLVGRAQRHRVHGPFAVVVDLDVAAAAAADVERHGRGRLRLRRI